MVWYKAALVITGAIKGTSKSLVQNLQQIEDGRQAFFFHKIIQVVLASYLQIYHSAVSEGVYLNRPTTQNKTKPIPARTKVFENSFFPYWIKEWNKLNDKIRNIKSKKKKKFKVTNLNFISPEGNSVFDIHNTNGIKLLGHSRLNFSHLKEHKFWQNFNHTVDPMCTCSFKPDTTLHYLLRCNLYST